ncbi:MAG: hypothetical protein U0793_00875 [Gemmataceae bacterium]
MPLGLSIFKRSRTAYDRLPTSHPSENLREAGRRATRCPGTRIFFADHAIMAVEENAMSIASDIVSAEFEARFQQAPAPMLDEKELARWRELCRVAFEERDRLRAEVATLTEEREYFRKALVAELVKEDVPFTKEEIMACRGQNPTLDEILEQFERGNG